MYEETAEQNAKNWRNPGPVGGLTGAGNQQNRTERDPQVIAELGSQEKLIAILGERFGSLRQRLVPVLLAQPPEETESDKRQIFQARCQLANQIAQRNSDLQSLIDLTVDLLQRLDV
jgi:hypothetical protein